MSKKRDYRKQVFITGATSGIGRACAFEFGKKGYNLILTGRRKSKLDAIKSKLQGKYAVDIKTLNFDVRDYPAAEKSVKSLKGHWKKIDILVNNAGLAKGLAPIHEGMIKDWETMIDTNIKGLLYMTRMIAPLMVQRQRGHIINIASIAGKSVYPEGNVYCATKAAVEALTNAMRLDLYKHNVRVSQVAPGHVEDTEFALVRFDGDRDRSKIYEDFVPLNSKDVAKIVYFIATQPRHVNIQDVLVMGTQQGGSNFIDRSGRK